LPEAKETPRLKIRIESLSDMIFGLALSIGAIFLIGNNSTDLKVVLSNLIAFCFSFLILVIIWVRYKRTVSVLRVETGLILELNIAMLFFVAIEPYLFNLLAAGASLNVFWLSLTPRETVGFTPELYALDTGSIYLILGILTYVVLREHSLKKIETLHPIIIRSFKQSMYTQLTASAIFLISACPIFWTNYIPILQGIPVGVALWCLTFVASFISRIVGIAHKHESLTVIGTLE
jgi:uncharacterized membrane protein